MSEKCKYCGGGAVDLAAHEENCVMRPQRIRGVTSSQIANAPFKAVFVWCNGHLSYPQALAQCLGREDLTIVGPSWLDGGRWQGVELMGLVIDHYAFRTLTPRQLDNCRLAAQRVRKENEAPPL